MIDAKKIEQIAEQISGSLPPGIKNLVDGLEDKVKTTLQAKLTQLDLVSREEFDVQTQVLARTRAKLDELEEEVNNIRKLLEKSE